MSGSKHTPGPWRAIAQGGSSTVVAPTMPARNDRRSEVPYGYRDGEGYCVGYPFLYQSAPYAEREETRMDFVCFSHADARLIAAAPDMYAAVKSFLPSKIDSGNRSVPDDIVIPLDVTIGELRRLEAAIAKAEGRS